MRCPSESDWIMWDAYCTRLRSESPIEEYDYLSPCLDSYGLPPDHFSNFLRQRTQIAMARNLLLFSFDFVRTCMQSLTLQWRIRGLGKHSQDRLASAQWVTYTHDLTQNRRKSTKVGSQQHAVFDVNPSFITRDFRHVCMMDDSLVASIALLSKAQFVRAMWFTLRILWQDKRRRLGRAPATRTYFGLLKAWSLSELLRKNSHVRLAIFWESRGFENWVARHFSDQVMALIVGTQGTLGTTFVNHRQMGLPIRSFFNNSWAFKLLHNKFKDGAAVYATLRDLQLEFEPQAAPPNWRSPSFIYVQSHQDFAHFNLSRLVELFPDLLVAYHPEFQGKRVQAIDLRTALTQSGAKSPTFLFSGVSTAAYQVLLARRPLVHVSNFFECNFLAPLGVPSVQASYHHSLAAPATLTSSTHEPVTAPCGSWETSFINNDLRQAPQLLSTLDNLWNLARGSDT